MNFVRSMYASVSALIRGDKSLNKKRENPYISTTQAREESVQEESQNDEHDEKDEIRVISEVIQGNSTEEQLNKGSNRQSNESLEKVVPGGAKNEEDDDDGEIDDDLMLHKKRKLSPCHIITEEEGITKEWENDFKIIKKNLERMNNLFKFYEDSANAKAVSKESLTNLPKVVEI